MSREERRCVCVIPFVERPLQVLLLRRVPERAVGWQPVTGRVEPTDRSLQAACLRELAEETGMREPVDLLDLDHETSFVGYDGVTYLQRTFAARCAAPFDVSLGDEHEESRWLSADEAAALMTWEDNRQALERLRQRLHRP